MIGNIHPIRVVGGGLAGVEAAWQIARFGLDVHLYEMRPVRKTPAHATDQLAELVCSNSLKSNDLLHAPGLLKEEMRLLDSIVIRAADQSAVPAGMSLAVDREVFSRKITEALLQIPHIQIIREEVQTIPEHGINIIATGPLTSEGLADSIRQFTQSPYLYYYDAISPIIEIDSIDRAVVFAASRFGRMLYSGGHASAPPESLDDRTQPGGWRRRPPRGSGEGDYLNCPMNHQEYETFYDALIHAEVHPQKDYEKAIFFEACLPIEEMARRGHDTLRFGPMKPVGLTDPRTGKRPYAVVQLRQDNLAASYFNMVGFQTSMKFSEQARVFRFIPGLQNAEFVRYGWIHRNTYLNAPQILRETYQTKANPKLFFAGQLSGVEGYVDSAASGLLAGINAALLALDLPARVPPSHTALGALAYYISHADAKHFQPMNITFGLLQSPEIQSIKDKQRKKQTLVSNALASIRNFAAELSPLM